MEGYGDKSRVYAEGEEIITTEQEEADIRERDESDIGAGIGDITDIPIRVKLAKWAKGLEEDFKEWKIKVAANPNSKNLKLVLMDIEMKLKQKFPFNMSRKTLGILLLISSVIVGISTVSVSAYLESKRKNKSRIDYNDLSRYTKQKLIFCI